MISKKLRGLLTLLAIGLTTLCSGQTDSNNVCLTPPQFDFYAQAVVEREALKQDTALWSLEALYLSDIISYKDNQINGFEQIVISKDKSIEERDLNYEKLSKEYNKVCKKHKRTKQMAMVLGITTCLLGVILILK